MNENFQEIFDSVANGQRDQAYEQFKATGLDLHSWLVGYRNWLTVVVTSKNIQYSWYSSMVECLLSRYVREKEE